MADPQPAPQKKTGESLQDRIKAQMENPTSSAPPVAAASVPVVLPQTPLPRPAVAETKGREKSTARATHYIDEQEIEWVRTGISLPNAYLKGIIAYVNEKRLAWHVGEPKVTQQDVEIEAIGIWLNDHRSELPPGVNAMCDEVRSKLRRS